MTRDSEPNDLSFQAREVIGYFETRRRIEDRNYAGLTHNRLVEYQREKKKFAGEHFEKVYRRWLNSGNAVLADDSRTKRDPRFRTYQLASDYDMFQSVQYAASM